MAGWADFNRNADLGNGRVVYRQCQKLPPALQQFLQFLQQPESWEKV